MLRSVTNRAASTVFSRVAAAVVPALGAVALSLSLAACGGQPAANSDAGSTSTASKTDEKTIVVGATPSPHAEILEQIRPALAEKGYELKIVNFNDYVQPNEALAAGELDANYFQHLPYLEEYNAARGTDLVSCAAIHFEPMAIFPKAGVTLENLPENAKILVPTDPTNQGRALQLLAKVGVISLKPDAGLLATPEDRTDNKPLQIITADAAALPRMLPDADLAVINGNFALSAGLDFSTVLATESADSEGAQTYANIVAIRAGDEKTEKTQVLVEALKSKEVSDFITSYYNGTVVPL